RGLRQGAGNRVCRHAGDDAAQLPVLHRGADGAAAPRRLRGAVHPARGGGEGFRRPLSGPARPVSLIPQPRGRHAMAQQQHWVGTWTASPAPSEAGYGLNTHTIRMNPRVSLGGGTIRVRVSNAYGARPLTIGAGTVALWEKGPGIVPGSSRALSFNALPSATVAAGAV